MTQVRAEELVQLTQDLPELGLYRGAVGLVCSTWFDPNTASEVEFPPDGQDSRVRTLLMPHQIQKHAKHSTN